MLFGARPGKTDSLTFSLRNAEAGAMILPVATKSPRHARGGGDGRGRAHLWHLRRGVAEEGIFLLQSVVTHGKVPIEKNKR